MLTMRQTFRPNAVFIPDKHGKEGRDFDRSDCTLLLVDGVFSYAQVYTEEDWQNDGAASYIQRRGDFFLPDGAEVGEGRVQLLPDPCIVKLPEKDYWCPDVQAVTTRLFGVYVLDRRQHFHLCEFCASYELRFLETQYEATAEVADNEDRLDELNQTILAGDCHTEPVSYWHRKDIDPLFMRGRRCRPGWLPTGDQGGGYRLHGLRAVTWEGTLEEIEEARCNSSF